MLSVEASVFSGVRCTKKTHIERSTGSHRSYNGANIKGAGASEEAPMKHKQETEIYHRGKQQTDAHPPI